MGMGSTLLDAASVNSSVMSRGAADCTTARGGGARTSLFGSIAQRFKALQSAAGFSHGISEEIEGNQPARSVVANRKRGFGGGGVGGKRALGWTGALTCSRYRSNTRKGGVRIRDRSYDQS